MSKKLTAVITGIVAIVCTLSSCGCKHEWKEATCQAPKTCTLCGITEGEVGEHQWADATCTTPKTCLLCGQIEGDALPHKWVPATCLEPKTCSVCGTVEGEALGHKWEAATCTVAKMCSVCKEIEGTPLEHTVSETETIIEPTCTENGIGKGVCTVCGNTVDVSIPALGHIPGDWVVVKEATYYESGEQEKICTVCNETVETEPFELTEEEKAAWYKNACESISYKEIARTPDDYKGRLIKITGEVNIIIQESETKSEPSIYLVYTKNDYGFYFEDPFFVAVDTYDNRSRIIEGDVITFYGEVDGLYDWVGEKEPRINVVYYDLKN